MALPWVEERLRDRRRRRLLLSPLCGLLLLGSGSLLDGHVQVADVNTFPSFMLRIVLIQTLQQVVSMTVTLG